MCESTYRISWILIFKHPSSLKKSNDVTFIEIGPAVSEISAAKHTNI